MSNRTTSAEVANDGLVVDPRAVRATTGPATRADDDPVLIHVPDGDGPTATRLERLDPGHAVLVEVADKSGSLTITRTRLLLGPERPAARPGAVTREIVVDGWRIEVELEPERRASLRERASRGRSEARASGPSELRAVIPGRIVAVSVTAGDQVEAGQQVLVVEAMKMQNELRAPRSGRVERVPGSVGQNVEVGDLLLVIS